MRAIFMVIVIVRGKVTKTASINHDFRREEIQTQIDWGPSAYQPNTLPQDQTSSVVLGFPFPALLCTNASHALETSLVNFRLLYIMLFRDVNNDIQ